MTFTIIEQYLKESFPELTIKVRENYQYKPQPHKSHSDQPRQNYCTDQESPDYFLINEELQEIQGKGYIYEHIPSINPNEDVFTLDDLDHVTSQKAIFSTTYEFIKKLILSDKVVLTRCQFNWHTDQWPDTVLINLHLLPDVQDVGYNNLCDYGYNIHFELSLSDKDFLQIDTPHYLCMQSVGSFSIWDKDNLNLIEDSFVDSHRYNFKQDELVSYEINNEEYRLIKRIDNFGRIYRSAQVLPKRQSLTKYKTI